MRNARQLGLVRNVSTSDARPASGERGQSHEEDLVRKLQPCGTRAAYARHLYNEETPCDLCKAANRAHVYSLPSATNVKKSTKLDDVIQDDPPVIVWTGGLVKRGIVLHDPYADKVWGICKRGHQITDDNVIELPSGRRCRTCKNDRDRENRKPLTPEQRARKSELEKLKRQQAREETPLLAAARTEV